MSQSIRVRDEACMSCNAVDNRKLGAKCSSCKKYLHRNCSYVSSMDFKVEYIQNTLICDNCTVGIDMQNIDSSTLQLTTDKCSICVVCTMPFNRRHLICNACTSKTHQKCITQYKLKVQDKSMFICIQCTESVA